MQPRSEESGSADRTEMDAAMRPAREGARGEQVGEIRRRISDDAYRSSEVADEIARRILLGREL
jgi:hypothetical protein